MNAFSRTELLFGADAMERLAKARVAVFGVGGVGGYAVEALARSGVGALDLVDDDTVCESNLNRQIIATRATIGMPKVDAAEERIRLLHPDCRVTKHQKFYLPETAGEFDFSQYDYVIDAIDTVSGKLGLAEQAYASGTPIISAMGAGRTGRDGIGGATGSSKVHTEASIEVCGAEVQKGNAPTERKIQRMFRREEVSKLIKKCNDFGAGGVSVAIGELAPGLQINLDKVPKKYAGLDGTEIAISESQERMAVVVDPRDVDEFMKYANEENLEAVVVAVVTEEPRLVLNWRGKEVVNISRAFLDTNGAHQETEVLVDIPNKEGNVLEREEKAPADTKAAWLSMLADLNTCSQKGLVEMFDGSIGAGSVFMPYGGKYQLTETQAMVAKVPVMNGKTHAEPHATM